MTPEQIVEMDKLFRDETLITIVGDEELYLAVKKSVLIEFIDLLLTN